MQDIHKSGKLVHAPRVCTGCGVCETMCSLYHEGTVGPALARVHVIRQPFTAAHEIGVCRQCSSPSCHFVCPLKDKAMCVDEVTGSTYINEAECTGCGMCVNACPFDPPRTKINVEKNVAFKCDLCNGRKGGPICVEYCPFQALKFVPKDKR